ncbi:MAG: Chromosome partition protein Smc [Actinobacteria bacterium]|nr:Chromosome partition protein Smc [Actinomycetota bacterium]
MYLEKVVLKGFKSFAEKTELVFEPGISVIVGPNGSGKSNIVEAIAWVLGEQRVKSLRGTRMEDVIFAGSPSKKPLGIAEVSLVFDNSDQRISLEFSEVAITRRVYRAGGSEYFLNSAPCRLNDILEVIFDAGMGRELHSIVSQGGLEEIILSKPLDRRMVIEEASGIVKFKRRREKTLRRLEATEENLLRVKDILREIDKRITPLKAQAKKAEEWTNLEKRLREVEIDRSLALLQRLNVELEGLEEEKRKRLEGLGSIAKLMEEKIRRAKNLDSRLPGFRNSYASMLEKRSRLQKEQGRLESLLLMTASKESYLKRDLASVRAEAQSLDRDLTEVAQKEEELQLAKDLFNQKNIELKELREKAGKIQMEMGLLDIKRKNNWRLLEKTAGRMDGAITRAKEELQKVDILGVIREIKKGNSLRSSEKYQEIIRALNSLEVVIIPALKEICQLNEERKNLSLSSLSLEEEVRVLEAEERELQQRKMELKVDIGTVGERIVSYESLLKGRRTADLHGRKETLQKEITGLENSLNSVRELGELGRRLKKTEDLFRKGLEGELADPQEYQVFSQELQKVQKEISDLRSRQEQEREEVHRIELAMTEAGVKRQELLSEMEEKFGSAWSMAQREGRAVSDIEALEREISDIRRRMGTIGPVNPLAAGEYARELERRNFLLSQIEDLEKSRDSIRKILREIDLKTEEMFYNSFEEIDRRFRDIIKVLFPEGDGCLEVDDEEGGIEIHIKNGSRRSDKLSLLSGGERALVSLAFLFAIYEARPSPFYVLDEVDAALDDVNLARFIALLENFKERHQVIVVTHQKRTMEIADVLYGVSMRPDSISKVISEKVEERFITAN